MDTTKGLTKTLFETFDALITKTSILIARKPLGIKLDSMMAGFKLWEIDQTLRRFERQEYIKKHRKGLFKLTQKGLKRINYYKAMRVSFMPQDKNWDGLWRIIIFDIPEKNRESRNILRDKIKSWHCYKLQNSVFVTPYVCEKELQILCEALLIQKYVHVITASKLGTAQKEVRSHFPKLS
jgi:DNA-binding transcriptional regulator PaaX